MCATASETFAANFPDALSVTSRLEDICLESLSKRVEEIDILLASPECTSHTCAKGGAPRDEASRATAMLVIEYARALRPRWLVLENVIHMRPWSRYNELKRALRDLGYLLEEHVLDATDFGVAQTPAVDSFSWVTANDNRTRRYASVPVDAGRQGPCSIRKGVWKTSRLFDAKRAAATLERAGRGFRTLGEEASFLLVYYGNDGAGGWQSLDRPLRTITTLDRFALIRH